MVKLKKIKELIISEQDIEDVLVDLDISKATETDLVSSRLLRSAKNVLK